MFKTPIYTPLYALVHFDRGQEFSVYYHNFIMLHILVILIMTNVIIKILLNYYLLYYI